MHPKNSNLSKRGFSLAQVLIAAAIIGGLAVVFSQIMNNAFKGQKSVSQSSEFQNLATLIKIALVDPAKCPLSLQTAIGAAVKPANPNPGTFAVADIPIGKIVVAGTPIADTALPVGGVTITSIKLVQVVAGNPTTSVPYTMKLQILGSKVFGAPGGSALQTEIPISVTITPLLSPTITTCSTTGGMIPAPPVCRNVSGPITTAESIAQCAPDEYLLSGGGLCESGIAGNPFCGGNLGIMHENRADFAGNRWLVNCFKWDLTGESCGQASAICCKKY